jgi:hypothetical protein
VLSDIGRFKLRPSWISVIACIVLTAIYWGNLFRFNPALIDKAYDDTSEASVVGRLARAAADGVFTHTDLGSNTDAQHPSSVADNYDRQVRFFEHPELLHSLVLDYANYPSHFGMQGFVFALIDLVDPLPRNLRLSFYHLLASLFTASMFVWMAAILRSKFGWAAFFGFLLPVAIEPMFSGLAPNLCWFAGSWLVPIPFGMLLADEDDARRKYVLLGLMLLAFLFRFLSGYEFVPTIILATGVGCMLTVKERPDIFRHVFRNASSVILVGVGAFAIAAVLHVAKQGGFTVFMTKAANRMVGDDASLQNQLILGKFQPIGAVVWAYLGGNYVTLIKSFGILLTLLALYAILILLDERFNWFYGAARRKLQVLALAVLASFAAPLSWFILGKGHSFDHMPYDMAMWYVPTVPLGFAMLAVAAVSFKDYVAQERGDALQSFMIASIPVVIVGTGIAIRVVDKNIETAGTWAITEHANAFPIFESSALGIDFRMSNDWFTLQYPCSGRPPQRIFVIKAMQDGKLVNYDIDVVRDQVFSEKGKCIAALAKSDRLVTEIYFGEGSKEGVSFHRSATISAPDTLMPEAVSNADWDRGINRESGTEILLAGSDFDRLMIKKGDGVQISPTDRRIIVSIEAVGPSRMLTLDGSPIHLADGVTPVFGIVRK